MLVLWLRSVCNWKECSSYSVSLRGFCVSCLSVFLSWIDKVRVTFSANILDSITVLGLDIVYVVL